MSIRYIISDSSGRYIMKNAAGQFVPVYDIAFADKYDSITKAKNILNSSVSKSMRKLFSVKDIEWEDAPSVTSSAPCVQETSSSSLKITYRPKQDQLLRLASENIAEEDLTFSKDNISIAIGSVESMRKRKETLQEQHSQIEKEILDIEHYIELSDNMNAYQGWLAYTMLRKRLKRRRQLKDELLVLSDVEDVMNGLRKSMSRIDSLSNRKYEPRILKELFT